MWYDAVVVAILLFTTVRGAMRGVIWQLAGLAGLVVCVVFAESISAAASPYVGLPEPLNEWVVMFVAYLVFSFFAFGVARLMHEAIEKAELKEYNRHLGALFGLIKGVAICLVLTFFIVTVSDGAREALKHSTSGRYAAIIMDRLHPVMPPKLHDALGKYIHLLDDPELDLRHADHDHHHEGEDTDHSHHDQTQNPPNPFASSAGGQEGTPASDTGIFDQILATIPGLISQPEMRDVVEQALRSTPSAKRGELLARLRAASPTQLRQIAKDLLLQTPGSSAPPSGGQAVEQMIRDIATAYAQSPAERTRVATQIEEQLRGLPDHVLQGVLVDWRADLSGGQQPDPDPQTNANTTIDQRIIRQLTIHRVSVWTLSEALQKRLTDTIQR